MTVQIANADADMIIALDRDYRRARGERDKFAMNVFRTVTGMEVPDIQPWRDRDGNLYLLHLDAWLERVPARRAERDGD
jgi:hypothetical protein